MNIKRTVLAALLIASLDARAGVILGGSTLVGSAGLSQLESWLGQGQLALTKLFTKTAGSTGYDFHAAADGKGPTFSLMSASEDGGATWKTIGGYNPASWDSAGGPHYSANQSLWTAFIFNLDDGVKRSQIGGHQTYNNASYGPTFGGGHDIYVDNALSMGQSRGYSYGALDYRSIVDGSTYDGWNMRIAALEVFSIAGFTPAPTGVPEPASLSLMGVGMLGWAVARRGKAMHPRCSTAIRARSSQARGSRTCSNARGHQHGRARAGLGQHLRGAPVAQREARGRVLEGLRQYG